MNKNPPFILRFLLPPLYATVAFAATVAVEEGNVLSLFVYLGIFALYAYLFAGLPSLLFAILISRFARRRPAFGGRLVRATLCGLVAGVLLSGLFPSNGFHIFTPLGAVVGFAVEGTVILLERRRIAT